MTYYKFRTFFFLIQLIQITVYQIVAYLVTLNKGSGRKALKGYLFAAPDSVEGL